MLKKCCEDFIRSFFKKYPDAFHAVIECPKCSAPWGFTFTNDVEASIKELKKELKHD